MSKRLKNYALTRKLIDNVNNNLSAIHQHQLRKGNTKALKIIAIVGSVYDEHKVFDQEFFKFLECLDSGKLNFAITQDIKNQSEYESFEKEHFQGVTSIDDVVRIEFKQHKLTLLQYEDRFRLLNIHNKQNKKTRKQHGLKSPFSTLKMKCLLISTTLKNMLNTTVMC